MNVLISYLNYFPKIGGAQNYIKHIAAEIAARKHRVTILCKSKKENMTVEKNGVRIVRYREVSQETWPKREMENLENFLDRKAEKLNPDVIICRHYTLVEVLKERFDVPLVFIPVSIHYDVVMTLVKNKIKKLDRRHRKKLYQIRIMEKRAATLADAIVVCSRMMKRRMKELGLSGAKKIEVVSQGVDTSMFKPDKKLGAKFKRRYNLPKGKFIVATVCRVAAEKNCGIVVDVAKKLGNSFVFVIAGDGREKESLRKEIKTKKVTNVKLTGWLNHRQVATMMKAAHVFLHPAIYESFGAVLLEALASGLPCLAFKPDYNKIITASEELIKDGKNGFLCNNTTEFAEKISMLASNRDLLNTTSKNARKFAKEFSWSKCAMQLLKICRDVCK